MPAQYDMEMMYYASSQAEGQGGAQGGANNASPMTKVVFQDYPKGGVQQSQPQPQLQPQPMMQQPYGYGQQAQPMMRRPMYDMPQRSPVHFPFSQ